MLFYMIDYKYLIKKKAVTATATTAFPIKVMRIII
jgi:hypothetical protein